MCIIPAATVLDINDLLGVGVDGGDALDDAQWPLRWCQTELSLN